MTVTYAPGSLVTARGREWVVLPDSEPDMLVLRPLAGTDDEVAAVFPGLEGVVPGVLPATGARRPRRLPGRQPAAYRAADRVHLQRRAVPLAGEHRGGTAPLPARPSADGAAAAGRPAGDLRRRRHRQDRRVRPDRQGAAGPGGGQRARRALLTRAGRAVAGRAADQVRHHRRADPPVHGAEAGARPGLGPDTVRAAPDGDHLHRLHQVAEAPRRLPQALPRPGDRRRGTHLRPRRRRPGRIRASFATTCCPASPRTKTGT